jgi:hypothetical protein
VFQSRSSNLVDDKLTIFGCQLNPGVVMVWLDDNPASVNDQVAADVQQAQLMEQCSSSFKKKIRRDSRNDGPFQTYHVRTCAVAIAPPQHQIIIATRCWRNCGTVRRDCHGDEQKSCQPNKATAAKEFGQSIRTSTSTPATLTFTNDHGTH